MTSVTDPVFLGTFFKGCSGQKTTVSTQPPLKLVLQSVGLVKFKYVPLSMELVVHFIDGTQKSGCWTFRSWVSEVYGGFSGFKTKRLCKWQD